jgi:RNA polymerase sigma-70 factor (ECF subfamily)
MDEPRDDELMERVLGGDHHAFTILVERHRHSLVNYVTHMTRSRDRAEEIAQDAFVRVYRNARTYDGKNRFAAWLYRIAMNLVITEVRRERRWSVISAALRPFLPASTLADDRVERNEICAKVQAALKRLPLIYRAPLVLFEMEEWSYEQIADALGVRPGTVKSRIARARELMRRELASWWIGGFDESGTDSSAAAKPAAAERVAGLHG